MDMIGHQDVRVDGNIVGVGRVIMQITQIAMVIVDCEETWLAIVSALNNMLRNTG
jgi:hypothetical protein